MRVRQVFTMFLLLFLFNSLALPSLAQRPTPTPVNAQRPEPIKITFGQPNIWSLEQAHYLLSQMRERSLGIKAKKLSALDPNTAEGARINLIRQLFGLSTELRQSPSIPKIIEPVKSDDDESEESPETTQTPVPFPTSASGQKPLDDTVLAKLLGDSRFLKKLYSDSKLNTSTQLDNHIQLQYEIIAKQLTLLRDEVGPDERLVFLELPQSIYASQRKTKGKVAQTYWQIAGYSTINKEKYVEATLINISNRIDYLRSQLNTQDESDKFDLKECKSILNKTNPDANEQQSDGQATKQKNDRKKEEICELNREYELVNNEYSEQSRTADYSNSIRRVRDDLESIRKRGALPNRDTVRRTRNGEGVEIKSAIIGDIPPNIDSNNNSQDFGIRAVDIIPRQSSLNVTDIKESVKSTFFSGALSFLFGFGAKTDFQRQRDSYEQYLHQDIYASGFGKGTNLFGWTFGSVPGTNRIAPGIRTTYAVLIVPKEAEALVINSRGCYFPRKNYKPENVMNTNEDLYKDNWWARNKRQCSSKKQFIIPIPFGNDYGGFYVTEIDYNPVPKGNQRLVATVEGRNFTTQVGILIDGTPLQQVTEITRKLPQNDLAGEFCLDKICGKYEIINSEKITFAFKMPKTYKGTPSISVVGVGRSIQLNNLDLVIRSGGAGTRPISCPPSRPGTCKLTDKTVPYFFGKRKNSELKLAGLKVFPSISGATNVQALLTGENFDSSDEIYIDGVPLIASHAPTPIINPEFLSINNFHIWFPKPTGKNSVTITIKKVTPTIAKIVTKTFLIKQAPKSSIISIVPISYDKVAKDMFVKIKGIGMTGLVLKEVNGVAVPAGSNSRVIPISKTEALVRIMNPQSTVKIVIEGTGIKKTAVIVRPIPKK